MCMHVCVCMYVCMRKRPFEGERSFCFLRRDDFTPLKMSVYANMMGVVTGYLAIIKGGHDSKKDWESCNRQIWVCSYAPLIR